LATCVCVAGAAQRNVQYGDIEWLAGDQVRADRHRHLSRRELSDSFAHGTSEVPGGLRTQDEGQDPPFG
jgi:hypothetical protein